MIVLPEIPTFRPDPDKLCTPLSSRCSSLGFGKGRKNVMGDIHALGPVRKIGHNERCPCGSGKE